MGRVQLENTPLSKLEMLFAADSHTSQSEVHVASLPTVLHISWCAVISVWTVHTPTWFCSSPTANHEMWQVVASCLHVLTSCVLHDIRSMKMHSRSGYVKMAQVLVMLTLQSNHANTRLQMNNVVYTSIMSLTATPSMNQLCAVSNTTGGESTGNCAITGTCIRDRVLWRTLHWFEGTLNTGKIEVLSKLFQPQARTLMSSGHRRWWQRKACYARMIMWFTVTSVTHATAHTSTNMSQAPWRNGEACWFLTPSPSASSTCFLARCTSATGMMYWMKAPA